MGLWDFTKRMIQGKPAFEVPPKETDVWGNRVPDAHSPQDEPRDDQQLQRERPGVPTVQHSLRYDSSGRKILPLAEIVRTEPHLSGQHLELWAAVRNQSKINLTIDKIYVLGAKQELDYPLPPGGERELLIFRGPCPTANSYKYAELYYKDQGTGDTFCAAHMIGYEMESNHMWSINELSFIGPVKDV